MKCRGEPEIKMDSDVKSVVDAATAFYGKISRAHENLLKLGTTRVTLDAAEVRFQALERNWSKFDALNGDLADQLLRLKDDPYMRQNIPGLAEEAYLNKDMILNMLQELKLKELVDAAARQSATSTPAPRITLPRIQLPQFSSRFENWPAFRDLFGSLVVNEPPLSKVEKIHYLKTSVKGDAEQLICNLALSPSST